MSEKDLNYFLEKSRVYGCEYNDYLSSHLPMALIALHRIGASKEQLSKFYSFYSKNLENLTPDEIKINSGNWNKFLGEHRHNSGYRDFFLSEVNAQGLKATLSYYLPLLIPGLSGGAFHPLIRLAYAIEVNSEWEVAEALASWCMAYQELGKIESSSKNSSAPLLDTLRRLAEVVKDRPIIVQGDNVFAPHSYS